MRGNLPVRRSGRDPDGSIPACAGEPFSSRTDQFRLPVYPRVCGGTRKQRAVVIPGPGLSPRVRGNHTLRRGQRHVFWSIPACAGEPSPWRPTTGGSRVYPRVCGGTIALQSALTDGRGLSPRVRGNPASRGDATANRGSIPACAGEPMTSHGWKSEASVYPRVCGGTPQDDDRAVGLWGLSPRVRGNHRPGQLDGAVAGSIPACAGEPPPDFRWSYGEWIYPRVCGGTFIDLIMSCPLQDLSPRVRGNPDGAGGAPPRGGSIPACAGEPTTTSS